MFASDHTPNVAVQYIKSEILDSNMDDFPLHQISFYMSRQVQYSGNGIFFGTIFFTIKN